MSLGARIRAFLHPPQELPPPPTGLVPGEPRTRLKQLEDRVSSLEILQVDRELQWTETKDKILRYLKRVQELDRRMGDDGAENGSDTRASAIKRAMEMKFPKREG